MAVIMFGAIRDHGSDQDACKRGFDPGLEQRQPKYCTKHRQRQRLCLSHTVQANHGRECHNCQHQWQGMNLFAVKERDDCNRAEVIKDCQGHQKYFESNRHPISQQGEQRESERNIGGHGDRPATQGFAVGRRKRDIDQGGNNHATQGGNCGQRRLAPRRQVPSHQFMFDFDTDKHKEKGHQTLIDPNDDRLVDLVGTQTDADLRVVNLGIEPSQRGIGRNQRKNNGDEYQNAGNPVEGHRFNSHFRSSSSSLSICLVSGPVSRLQYSHASTEPYLRALPTGTEKPQVRYAGMRPRIPPDKTPTSGRTFHRTGLQPVRDWPETAAAIRAGFRRNAGAEPRHQSRSARSFRWREGLRTSRGHSRPEKCTS